MSSPRKTSVDLLDLEAAGDSPCDDHDEFALCRECFPIDDPIEFTETSRGYQARHKWARGYDDLNGAPEGDWDR